MPAGNTYESIATQTLGTAAASVTFSSISGTYTDLVFVMQGAVVSTGADILFRVNGDTASNYSFSFLLGDGTTTDSSRRTGYSSIYLDWISSINTTLGAATHTVNIMNYANTTDYKTVLVRGNRASSGVDTIAGLWRNTAAITSITISTSPNLATGSTFSLYGIKAA